MARIRTIKPEILEDERTAGLTDAEWRLFVSAFLLADDHGRLRAHPRYLLAQVFWDSGKTREDVDKILEGLANRRLVRIYQVRGQTYAEIRGWGKHQRVDKPGKPRVPAPEESDSEDVPPVSRENSRDPSESRESLAPDHDHDHDLGKGARPSESPEPVATTRAREGCIDALRSLADEVWQEQADLVRELKAEGVKGGHPPGAMSKLKLKAQNRLGEWREEGGLEHAQSLARHCLAVWGAEARVLGHAKFIDGTQWASERVVKALARDPSEFRERATTARDVRVGRVEPATPEEYEADARRTF